MNKQERQSILFDKNSLSTILRETQNMSYIYCYNDSSYKLSENFRELLQIQITQPFRDTKPEVARLYDQRDYTRIGYLLKNILQRGSANFDVQTTDERFGVFTPTDKVLFYSANYIAMHLCSSYHIYNTYLIPQRSLIKSRHIVFIDYGCGPLTSGIAFWNAAEERNITYIGIDISQNMLNKALEINRYSPDGNRNPYFKNIYLKQNYEVVPKLLKDIEKSNSEDVLIIFNFCYVLADITFKGDINSFINVLKDAIQVSISSKVCIINQNPVGYNSNWRKLRNEVINYPYFSLQNFAEQNGTESFKYELLLQGTESQKIDVNFGMIYNW